jgi:hypothetical protein
MHFTEFSQLPVQKKKILSLDMSDDRKAAVLTLNLEIRYGDSY